MSVSTGADDLVNQVRVGWRAPCRKGRYVSRTLFLSPLDVSEPPQTRHNGLRDAAHGVAHLRRGPRRDLLGRSVDASARRRAVRACAGRRRPMRLTASLCATLVALCSSPPSPTPPAGAADPPGSPVVTGSDGSTGPHPLPRTLQRRRGAHLRRDLPAAARRVDPHRLRRTAGSSPSSSPDGERARGRVSVDGGLRRSGRWTGNFRIRVRVTRNGRFVANCRSGRIGWRASPR